MNSSFSFTSLAPAVIYNVANANNTQVPGLHINCKETYGNRSNPPIGETYIVGHQLSNVSF